MQRLDGEDHKNGNNSNNAQTRITSLPTQHHHRLGTHKNHQNQANGIKKKKIRVVTKGRPPTSSSTVTSPYKRIATTFGTGTTQYARSNYNQHHQANKTKGYKSGNYSQNNGSYYYNNPNGKEGSTTPIKNRKFVNKLDEDMVPNVHKLNAMTTMNTMQTMNTMGILGSDKTYSKNNDLSIDIEKLNTPQKSSVIQEETPLASLASPRSISTPESQVSMHTPPSQRNRLKLGLTSPLYSIRDELKEGSKYYKNKQYGQAIEHWMRVLKQCPHNGGVLHAIALAYDAKGYTTKCRLWVQKAAALDHLPSCFILGTMLYKGIGRLQVTSYDDDDDDDDDTIPPQDIEQATRLFQKIYKSYHPEVRSLDPSKDIMHWEREAEDLIQLNENSHQQYLNPTTAIHEFSFISR